MGQEVQVECPQDKEDCVQSSGRTKERIVGQSLGVAVRKVGQAPALLVVQNC